MSNSTACPSCGGQVELPEGLSGLQLRCRQCGCAFLGQVALPRRPAREPEPAVFGYADPGEPDPATAPGSGQIPPGRHRSYAWVRCGSCGELNPPQLSRCPYCGEAPDSLFPPPRRDVEPHRAGLLQLLATVSVVSGALSCALFAPLLVAVPLGITTWALAQRDLSSMRRGTMDRTGMVQTRGARDTAVIGSLLGLTSVVGLFALLGVRFLQL